MAPRLILVLLETTAPHRYNNKIVSFVYKINQSKRINAKIKFKNQELRKKFVIDCHELLLTNDFITSLLLEV